MTDVIEVITQIQLTARTFRADALPLVVEKASGEWNWLDHPLSGSEISEFLERAARGSVATVKQARALLTASSPSSKDPYGSLSWSSASDRPALGRDAHCWSVANAMEMLGSPVAWATSEQAWRNLSWRLGRDSEGSRLLFTVRGIDDGLKGPFWRMWFREPYLTFLNLKPNAGNVHFVEFYEDPAAWESPAAVEAMRKFRQQTREDAFYDPEQPDRKLSAPEF